MDKYSCERCGKEFSQKSHYDAHKKRKTPCENNADKIKALVNKAVEEKMNELNEKKLIVCNEDTTVHTTMQTTGLKRDTIDKFYTSPLIVNNCMDIIKKTIDIRENDLCIEPSAGNGSFINAIKQLFKKYKFYDLKPENNEIIQKDYLEFDYKTIKKNPKNQIHIIGNPPFGRQSSLAIKFVKKSCEYCDSISFILPKSFKKESLKKHYPLQFHLKYEYDLPQNSFIVDGKEYDVPCVFQIWVKQNNFRTPPTIRIPNKYNFVKKNEDNDISFRRVGVNAGYIDRETQTKSIQSHYFIKFDKELTDELFEKLSNIVYNCKHNTCGPKSISKQELIEEFNKIII
tara:strand:- start:333 stop:1361 length:1029 start_codon:yes stop_codon:yes gene_type:complete